MTKRMKYSLSLRPFFGNSNVNNAAPNSADEWLNNDSSNILQSLDNAFNPDNNQPNITNVMHKLSNSPEKRIINVDQLVITETERGFNILESNAQTTLKDDDIISIGGVQFQVRILSEAIVEYEGPQRRYDFDTLNANQQDSWTQTPEQNDPFLAGPAPMISGRTSTAAPAHDPLSFLYSGTEQQPSYQHALSHQHNQAPEVLSPHSTIPLSQGLNIDTRNRYTPTRTHGELPQAYDTSYSEPAGNILNDLGINGTQNSSILSGRYGQSGKTLDEKSPLDMLDEYLDEPISPNLPAQYTTIQSPPAYPAPRPFHHDVTPDSSITRSLKGVFKKLIS